MYCKKVTPTRFTILIVRQIDSAVSRDVDEFILFILFYTYICDAERIPPHDLARRPKRSKFYITRFS